MNGTAGSRGAGLTTSRATATPRLLLGLAATLIVLLVSTGVAQAAITYPYTGTSFGPEGVGASTFDQGVGGVAVQESTGDVFVYDGNALYKFNAAGEPADFSIRESNVIKGAGHGGRNSEIAVDNSAGPAAGDIYIADEESVEIYSEAGARLGELTGQAPCGVAVGPAGDVYVGDSKAETVTRYTPTANPVTSADESGMMSGVGSICGVAVDSSGDVYAARNNFFGRVTKYDAAQFGSLAPSGEVVDSRGKEVAVDPVSGEVLIDQGTAIAEYDGSTTPPTRIGAIGETGEGELKGSNALALNATSGKIYAGQYRAMEIFGPKTVVPDLSVGAAKAVTDSEATVEGTVEPAGTEVTGCIFEYGEYGNLSESVPCEPTTPYTGSGEQAVTATLTGLALGKTYYYRVAVSGTFGSVGSASKRLSTEAPRVSEEPATNITAAGAELHGVVEPSELTVSVCNFDYGTERNNLSKSVPCEPATPYTGSGEQAVTAQLSGLSLGTTYYYAISAGNAHGTVSGRDEHFETLGPKITGSYFAKVSATTATVGAEVAPKGEATTYVVEYGTTAEYGSTTAQTSVGGGAGQISVEETLGELSPQATYHVRVVATNASGTFVGPDMVFTTAALGTPGLPDNRGYELVSPITGAGTEFYVPFAAGYSQAEEDVVPSGYWVAAAANGNAVSYIGTPTATGNGSEGQGNGNQFMARRSADGGEWAQSDIQPNGYRNPYFVGFSRNLSRAVLYSPYEEIAGQGPPHGYAGLYVMNEANETTALFSVQPPNRPPSDNGNFGTRFKVQFVAGTPDFSHLLFAANDALTGEATDPGPAAFNLYEYVEGGLRLVNVLPNGTPAPNATFGAEEEYSHVISSDGSRIFWTDLNTGALYVREDGARTTLVAHGATYLGASSDGSKVIYVKSGGLYEDDLSTETTAALEPGAEMVGILGASEDLSYIYFVARGELAPGAEPGENNLYVWHDGETRYIATLGSGREEEAAIDAEPGSELPWLPNVGHRTAKVTPSGRYVAFMSSRSLTGYDNTSVGTSFRAHDVYTYDAASGALSCVSCRSTGEPGAGGFLPFSGVPNRQLNVISEEGTVFFDSASSLLPQATDGHVNVYEWQRPGTGSCTKPSGCLSLLSTGNSTYSSYLIDASVSGNDVFMMTRSQIAKQDTNDNYNVYDVRVGAVMPPVPVRCAGTGCQGAPAPPPLFATPPSVTFSGAGNLRPVPPKSHKGKKNGKHKGKGRAARKRRRKLHHALRRCVRRHRHNRHKRRACKRRARRRYGAKAGRRHGHRARHPHRRRGRHGHASRNRHHNGRGK